MTGDIVSKACYWKDGTRTDLPVPSGYSFSIAVTITIVGTDIYVAGSYETGGVGKACYWKNNGTTIVKTDLATVNSDATSITAVGTDIYIAGAYEPPSGSVVGKACYWKNGAKIDLPVPSGAFFSVGLGIVVVP